MAHIPKIKLNLPRNRLRNSLTQLSDFFSEFHAIAPGSNFDRPERSISMRLYWLDKRSFLLVLLAFLACFSLGIFIGLAGPEITLTREVDATSTGNSSLEDFFAKGPFVIQTGVLGTYSRQLWLFARYTIENTENEIFDSTFQVESKIKGMENGQLIPLLEYTMKNRSRHLKCKGDNCEEFTILHMAFLEYSHYQIVVKFFGINHKRYNINRLAFYLKTFNPAFTSLEISFRFVFLLSIFVVTCWYYHTLRKYPSCNWTIEQKFVSILLPMLIMFNNPLFPLIFLIGAGWSTTVGLIDAFFQTIFITTLLLFWICVYHALRQNQRKFSTFYLPKILILSPIFFTSVTLAIWEKSSELKDPTFYHMVDANYSIYLTFFYVSIALYLLYLTFLMFTAYSELKSMQFFDMRLKFLTLLMLFVMTVTVTTTLSRFGSIGIIEDNFVGQLATNYKSSAHFMCFYGMINFYIVTMAYVYSPVNTITEPVRKDNPAFSMINDDEDDIEIFGETEDLIRPLNASNKTNEYDSD